MPGFRTSNELHVLQYRRLDVDSVARSQLVGHPASSTAASTRDSAGAPVPCRDEVLATLTTVSDFSYAWGIIDAYTPVLQAQVTPLPLFILQGLKLGCRVFAL